MRKLVVVFMAIAILLIGCSSRPPMPVLKAGKIEIPAVLGTYSWKTFNKQVIADAPGPDYLVKDLTPIAVQPKEEVLVKFSSKPSKMIPSIRSIRFNLPTQNTGRRSQKPERNGSRPAYPSCR